VAAPFRPGDRRHAVEFWSPRRRADTPGVARLFGGAALLAGAARSLRGLEDLAATLDRAVAEEPPATLKEGNLIRRGWSLKSLHRKILMSAAYQRSSADDERGLAADPDNRLIWRFNRRRLEAEAIRDALLATSGTLDLRRPGEHPFPPINQWGWTQHSPFKDVYPSQHRSVYLMTQRFQRHPVLALFDSPDTNTSTESRAESIVPLQALFFMNSPLIKAESEAFAARLIGASPEVRERIGLAYELAYARPATGDELARGEAYLTEFAQHLAELGLTTFEIERQSWLSFARTLLAANEFVFID
jgi:hypothetical protein